MSYMCNLSNEYSIVKPFSIFCVKSGEAPLQIELYIFSHRKYLSIHPCCFHLGKNRVAMRLLWDCLQIVSNYPDIKESISFMQGTRWGERLLCWQPMISRRPSLLGPSKSTRSAALGPATMHLPETTPMLSLTHGMSLTIRSALGQISNRFTATLAWLAFVIHPIPKYAKIHNVIQTLCEASRTM